MRLSRLIRSHIAKGRRSLTTQVGSMPAVSLVETLSTPGMHERELTKLFDDRMRFDGMSPIFEHPLMIIAFTNRSGSNLVCDYVTQSGRVGGAGEFLNHEVVAKRCMEAQIGSLPDYIVNLYQLLGRQQNILALKASWDQLAMLLRNNILAMFPKIFVLHCTRVDTLSQAVSYAIALSNGRWMQLRNGLPEDPLESTGADPISLAEIEQQMEVLHRANLLIRLLCEAHGLQRWEIGYERLCQDKGAHLAQCLRAMEIVPTGWMPGEPHLERQAGARNIELSAAFHALIRANIGTLLN